MITDLAGVVWKKIPWGVRRFLVRATQDTFTVSVAAVVLNASGEVLLLDHLIRPNSGWGVPGGFLDRGEQPEDGVRREVREETGLELSDLELLRVRAVGGHVEVLFKALSAGKAEVKSREIKSLGWFDADSLPAAMEHGQRQLVAAVLADRKPAARPEVPRRVV